MEPDSHEAKKLHFWQLPPTRGTQLNQQQDKHQQDSSKTQASPIVHIVSSTYHLSQVALRELRRTISLELPSFPPENLIVELGPYGAFDVRIDGVLVCETSRSLLYHPVASIVDHLARVAAKLAVAADLQLQQLENSGFLNQRDSSFTLAESAGAGAWETDSLWSSSRSSVCSSHEQLIAAYYNHSDVSPDGTLLGEEFASLHRGSASPK